MQSEQPCSYICDDAKNNISIPQSQHKQEQTKQLEKQFDRYVWQCREKLYEKYNEKNKGFIHKQIQELRLEYFSQCLDLLLRIYHKTYNEKSSEQQIQEWQLIMEAIDTAFLDRYITIKIETGENNNNIYSEYWKSLLLHLWNQKIGSVPYIICQLFFVNNTEHLLKIVNKIMSDIKILSYQSQDEQSPIFSDDSFNPVIVKNRKSDKKYKKYKLCNLLSSQHVNKMKKRLLTLNNSEIQEKLVKNLEKQLGGKQKQ